MDLVTSLFSTGRVLFQPGPAHDGLDAVAAEALHQLVFQGHVELGTAGVALASGAAPKLVVDAAGVVVLGADDVEAAQFHNAVVFLRPVVAGSVSAPPRTMSVPRPGHVGGDGDRAQPTGLGDDLPLPPRGSWRSAPGGARRAALAFR